MAACPRCGYENAEAVDFCANPDCRADLRPDLPQEPAPRTDDPVVTAVGPRAAPAEAHAPPRRPSAPPPPASGPPPTAGPPPGEQKKGMRITADPLELRVEPGGPPASTTVTVRNRGTKVEHFQLGVNGPVAAFAQVQPPVLQVFPDTEETAQVRFAVPRAPEPPAGRYAFQIVARGRVDPDVTGRVAGGLTLGRFDEMVATIEPEMTRGRKPGNHRLTVINRGNGPLDVQVAMTDQQGELMFDPPRFGGLVGPGTSATENVVVRAPLKWFGRTQVHPFTGNVSTDAPGQAAMVQARRRQVPRFPWWVPTAVLAVIALAIPIYALWPEAKVPKVAGLDRVAAVTKLQDAGLKVVEIEKPDPNIPVNQALGTVPEADKPYEEDEVAQLFVSRGPCPGDCPIKIPLVDGLQVEEAKSALVAAGFVVERVNQVPDQRPAGTVVTTTPPGGQEAPSQEKVVINAAIGPEPPAPTPPDGQGSGGPPPVPVPVPGQPPAPGPATVPIPPLAGKPGPEVVKTLTDLGMTVQQVRTHTNEAARDVVLSITPPPGEQVPPKTPVTVELAAPTAVDLAATASTASWSDETGPLVFGPPVPGRGAAFLHPATTVLEDGEPAAALAMEPGPAGRVTAAFTLPQPVIPGDHVRALVGLLPGAAGTTEFTVTANGILLTPTISDTSSDGALKLLDVDLGPVVGATALQISVKAAPGSADNRAFLKDLRIEGLIG